MAHQSSQSFYTIREVPFDLKVGEEHEGIGQVKKYLGYYGYYDDDVSTSDNKLDTQTQKAITKFQEWFGLNKTGGMDGPTKAAITRRRCALSGGNPLAARTIGPWNKKSLTYAFGPTSRDLDSEVCKNAVRRAFQTWVNAGVGLSFQEVTLSVEHDIYIDFRRARDPDLSMVGPTLAHADFPPGHSLIATNGPPLPLHFDDSENVWVDGAVANAFDIETVALHEIGHCLGLLHSNVGGAVMFPTVSDNKLLRSLTADDNSGIQNLYP
jgi:hypothetical protein